MKTVDVYETPDGKRYREMKPTKVWVTEDGKEFDTELDATVYEHLKFVDETMKEYFEAKKIEPGRAASRIRSTIYAWEEFMIRTRMSQLGLPEDSFEDSFEETA